MYKRHRSPELSGLVLAASSLLLLACTRPQATPPAPAAPPPPADAGAKGPSFALAAIESVDRLHKLLDGQVLASSGGALHVLEKDGSVRSLENVFAALKDTSGTLGSVGGSWPGALFVETFRLDGGDGVTTSFILRGSGSTERVLIERRVSGAYWLPPARWRNGALLTLRADGHSRAFGAALDRSARFEIAGGAREPLPQLPRDTLSEDAFVAYPSGAIFVLGGRRTRPVRAEDASEYEQEHRYMLDGAIVWQRSDAAKEFVAVQLPETTPRDRLRNGTLAMGRSESETLVFGTLEIWKDRQSSEQPYLARYGPSGWRRVPIDTPVLRIDSGGDGTTWAICGSDGYGKEDHSFLRRVTLTSDGSVGFAPVPVEMNREWLRLGEDAARALTGCTRLRPRELAAGSESDLWLTAQCVGIDYPPMVLLHTQPQGPLKEWKTFEIEPPRSVAPPTKPRPRERPVRRPLP